MRPAMFSQYYLVKLNTVIAPHFPMTTKQNARSTAFRVELYNSWESRLCRSLAASAVIMLAYLEQYLERPEKEKDEEEKR